MSHHFLSGLKCSILDIIPSSFVSTRSRICGSWSMRALVSLFACWKRKLSLIYLINLKSIPDSFYGVLQVSQFIFSKLKSLMMSTWLYLALFFLIVVLEGSRYLYHFRYYYGICSLLKVCHRQLV